MTAKDTLSDEELAVHARDGNEQAFNELVDRFTPVVYRVARGITGSGSDAEDIVQETFLRAFKHIGTYSPDQAAFRTWVLTIARNLSINLFHSLKRRAARFLDVSGSDSEGDQPRSLDLYAVAGNPNPEMLMLERERMRRLETAMDKLPRRQRAVLVLKAYEGLSYAEIAAIMETSASSVESLIFRARKRITELLEEGP
jgi:RNA polymerase sigma factor (sigma-70 family)